VRGMSQHRLAPYEGVMNPPEVLLFLAIVHGCPKYHSPPIPSLPFDMELPRLGMVG